MNANQGTMQVVEGRVGELQGVKGGRVSHKLSGGGASVL